MLQNHSPCQILEEKVEFHPNATCYLNYSILRSADVEINPGPVTNNTLNGPTSNNILNGSSKVKRKSSISFLSFNARRIKGSKLQLFQDLVFSGTYDVFSVTATWLNESTSDNEILNGCYTIYLKDRVVSRGGGVMTAVGKKLESIRRADLEHNLEMLVIELQLESV